MLIIVSVTRYTPNYAASIEAKPLRTVETVLKIADAFDPELKHGENESFARGSLVCRELI